MKAIDLKNKLEKKLNEAVQENNFEKIELLTELTKDYYTVYYLLDYFTTSASDTLSKLKSENSDQITKFLIDSKLEILKDVSNIIK